jgi:vanillate O-demethylase monooxygenase subunit
MLLNEPLVFYRSGKGDPIVLDDRCPHRYAPLSSGPVVGDAIQCGYHGWEFGPDGACICIPGMDRPLKAAKVRSYQALERWGWIYVWMGDPDLADEDLLPSFHYMADPAWTGSGELMHVEAGYHLIRDNLLDLTHAKYVHKTTLATQHVTDYPVQVVEEGRQLFTRRDMLDVAKASPLFQAAGNFQGRIDHRQNFIFEPPNNILVQTVVESAASENEDIHTAFKVANALVPETDSTCHYFWFIMRDFKLDDEDLTEWAFNANRGAFLEDKTLIEQQQKLWETTPNSKAIPYMQDKGVIRANEIVSDMVAAERSLPV